MAEGSPPRLLSSRLEWTLYALAWSVFTVGFAAVFWLQNRTGSVTSLLNSGRIVLPAALLGIAVIRLSERVSLRPWPGTAVHVLACLAFPAVWIGAVNVLNNAIACATTGVLRWRLPPEHVIHWHYLAGIMIYVALAALTYGRLRVFRAERQRLWAEWRGLRGQLNPHFVFNTLHTVFGLARLEPASGEAAMARFSRALRYLLLVHRDDRDLAPLCDEWNFAEDYLYLESLRLGERLTWRSDIAADVTNAALPALLIQPLVENAVRHSGLDERDGVMITVTAQRAGDVVVVNVADNGKGSTLDAASRSPGVGLRAARTRMRQLSTAGDAFTIETAPGAGFAVTLRIPYLRVQPSRTALDGGPTS